MEYPESRQGMEQMRIFDPTNDSADCWYSYDYIITVK